MTVLIADDGAIQLCVDSGWPLPSLARERSAKTAFRVSLHAGRITVEGIAGF